MKRLPFRTAFYLFLDSFLLLVCFVHIPYVVRRPSAPFEVAESQKGVVISRVLDSTACAGIRVGDVLSKWEGEPVVMPEMVEYLADIKPIGTEIGVQIQRDDRTLEVSVLLKRYYESIRFLIISVFVGLTVFSVGVFILLSRPGDVAARALHWSLITLGTTLMLTWGAAEPGSFETSVARFLWFISYLGVAVAFFFFSLVFPRERSAHLSRFAWLVVIVVIGLGSAFGISYLSAIGSKSAQGFKTFQAFFDVFHVSLFAFVGGGLYNLGHATILASSDEERRKMYWVVWSLALGTTPYLFLHILPQLLFSRYIISEEFTTIFFLAVPVGFAIALLKYRLLDIELVVNRTIVYAILSSLIVTVYALTVLLMTSIIGEVVFEQYMLVAVLTLVVGMLINPLRVRLQSIVGEVLFPAKSNFRRALSGAVDLLRSALNRRELFDQLLKATHGVVRGDMIAVYEVQKDDLELRAFQGGSPIPRVSLNQEMIVALKAPVTRFSGTGRTVGPEEENSIRETVCRQFGWTVCAPILSQGKELLGALALNPRRGEHFEEEELNFLEAVAEQSSEFLERLILQEKIILAQEEKRRSEELSALKSYFISSVSHELRMPLTSIRMFAEMLRTRSVSSPRRQREYLEIIEGESERLSRLIGNILDFAKIERGVKEYNFSETDVAEIVKRSVGAMHYQFLKHGGKLRTRVQKGLPTIWADGDALEEALLNLLSNALKYSTTLKDVNLNVVKMRGKVVISVADKGVGIPGGELGHIFERFYRVPDERTRQVGGAGLGLAVVKHIVTAHGGTLGVKSILGKGSTFTIELPVSVGGKRKRT